tara:strand:+ start:33155 stop:34237 length:1083 start_codon:yes stop_codon:yes gene_type:complete
MTKTYTNNIKDYVPGLILGIIVAIFSHYGAKYLNHLIGYKSLISSILLGIIIGILIKNIFGIKNIFDKGLDLNVKKILRIGIVILGIRLSIFEIFSLGISSLPIIILCILSGLLAGYLLTKLLSLPNKLGILIAVGTSICGASAIVATAPGIKAKQEEIAYSITVITIFGIIAMLFYPFLSNFLGLGEKSAGLFLGTSIHETAQVTGAGFIYDETFGTLNVGKYSVTVKLVRNLSMIIVIPLMTILYQRESTSQKTHINIKEISKLIPLFIIGFFIMSILRTSGDFIVNYSNILSDNNWQSFTKQLTSISKFMLVVAMASVGLTTDIKSIKNLGLKPFLVGIFVALIVGICSLLSIIIIN